MKQIEVNFKGSNLKLVPVFSDQEISVRKLARRHGISVENQWYLIGLGLIRTPHVINYAGEIGIDMNLDFDPYVCPRDDEDELITLKDVFDFIEKYLNKPRNLNEIFWDALIEEHFIDPVGCYYHPFKGFQVFWDKQSVDDFFSSKSSRDEFLENF